MSSLSRTIQRNGNPEYFPKRPGGGLKPFARNPRAGKRRLKIGHLKLKLKTVMYLGKPIQQERRWQCACGRELTAGSQVLRFAGSQLCTVCGYPKFKEMAAIKGWK